MKYFISKPISIPATKKGNIEINFEGSTKETGNLQTLKLNNEINRYSSITVPVTPF